jgi:hypothetical protein
VARSLAHVRSTGYPDEEPEVVQLCQAVVGVIEHYVGEPLQKYFQ